MGTEAEQEAMAVGEAAEGGGSPRRRSGWGVGEAPMDAEVEAAQRADNFRLIDMVEIYEQACWVRGRGRGRVSVSVCVRGRFRVSVRVRVRVRVRVS